MEYEMEIDETKIGLMEIVEEMLRYLGVRCKYCASVDVSRNGTWCGQQRYICRRCGRGFTNPSCLPRSRFSIDIMGSALNGHFSGMSLKKTAGYIEQDTGLSVNEHSIYVWLKRFIPIAGKIAQAYTPTKVSSRFIADETVLHIGGKKWWLHTCICAQSRFLLATHVSRTRTRRDARMLMEKATERAGGKVPRVVLTDGVSTYIQAVDDAYGSDVIHVRTSPFAGQDSTVPIERWHSTLKERVKTLKGFQDVASARLWLRGFVFHYNFLRPHEGLGEKTPAEVAGINFPYKTWRDIVATQAYPTRPESVGDSIATSPLGNTRVRPMRKRQQRSFIVKSQPVPPAMARRMS